MIEPENSQELLNAGTEPELDRESRRLLAAGIFYLGNVNSIAELTAAARPRVNGAETIEVLYALGGLTSPGGHPVQIYDRLAPHLGWAPERIWKVRAKGVVLATGAIERPLVFPNNDRPGIMSAAAVRQYIRRYGVRPGRQTVVLTNNDSAYDAAIELRRAGAEVVLLDIRPDPPPARLEAARANRISVRPGRTIIDVRGRSRVTAVRLGGPDAAPAGWLPCDLVAVSGGWTPTVHLQKQSGGALRYDESIAAFVPDRPVQDERSVGAARGLFALATCLADGHEIGAEAARFLGYTVDLAPPRAGDEAPTYSIAPSWQVNLPGARQWVDYQNDVTVGDIRLAARENYWHFIFPVMSLELSYALPLIRQAAELYARARRNLLEEQNA